MIRVLYRQLFLAYVVTHDLVGIYICHFLSNASPSVEVESTVSPQEPGCEFASTGFYFCLLFCIISVE